MKKHVFLSNVLLQFVALILCIVPNITLSSSEKKYVLPCNRSGYTAMHNAALENDPLTIKTLAKAFPDEVNRHSETVPHKGRAFKNTPAHLAVFYKNWQAFSMLVAFNADLLAVNAERKKPYQHNQTDKDKTEYSEAILRGIALKKEFLGSKPTSIQKKQAESQTDILKVTSTEAQTNPQTGITPPPSYQDTKHQLNPEARCFFPNSNKEDSDEFEKLNSEIKQILLGSSETIS